MIENSALIVVDVLNGFSFLCSDELPVPAALKIVPGINRLLELPWKMVIATQDWHPDDHCSFLAQGGPYPIHCVQGRKGADFVPTISTHRFHSILRKGFRRGRDAYSAGDDHPGLFRGMVGEYDGIYLVGVCTNICVYETARDFKVAGHERVSIVEDCCASLELPEGHAYHPPSVRQLALQDGIVYIASSDVFDRNSF